MKSQLVLPFLAISFLLLASCSVEDLVKEEPNNTEILTANSPWEFESFQLLQIVKKRTIPLPTNGSRKL